jgi:hypothetical protein
MSMNGSFDLWMDDIYAAFRDCKPMRRRCSCPSCFYALQKRRGVWGDAERAGLRERVIANVDHAEMLPMTYALEHLDWLLHALPWLLEVLLCRSTLEIEHSLRPDLFRALHRHQWTSWAAEQVSSIDRVLAFLWESNPPPPDMEGLLLDLSLVRDDVTPLLDGWLQRRDPFARELLAEFIVDHAIPLAEGKPLRPPYGSEAALQITRWLRRDQTLAELEKWGAEDSSAEAGNAALAREHLRWIRAALPQ